MVGRPQLTVGLPVYNGERFLREVIDCLRKQELEDFELLLADNGSTDATAEICAEAAAADDRIRVLAASQNKGAAWNFNRVVHEAQGDYFTWAADDDLYEPAFHQECVSVLDARPEVVLCYTQATEIDERGQLIEHRGPLNEVRGPGAGQRFAKALAEIYCYAVFGVIRTDVLRRTALIGPYTGSDKVLLAELALHGPFHESPEPLFCHREHPGRSMHAFADDRDRQTWFDTSRNGEMTLPRWRLGHEYTRAIHRARPPADQWVLAHAAVARWAGSNRRVLSRELGATALKIGKPRRSVG